MLREKTLAPHQWNQIQHLIPGAEPILHRSESGRHPEGVRAVIPVSEPSLKGNELRYVTECVESNWISSAGPFVKRFEEQFAAAAGCEFGVSCCSGTTALHLALAALGVGPGDEVLLPTFTMVATASAVHYVGATAVLVDAEPETWNLDVAQIEAKITPRTKAIIVVHTYGHPADMDAVMAIARRHHLYVVEDAAEAHGAEYHGRPVGSLADVACFSFYANKIITTGEGGMVTSNNREIAAVARRLRDHAFSDERHFWHQYKGFSYRMTSLQAAVGVAQTERLRELVDQRRTNAALYRECLRGVRGLSLPQERPGIKNVFWMYGVMIENDFGCSRDDLRQLLAEDGIETRTFFVPIHLQPVHFTHYDAKLYPVADSLCQKGMYLPSSSGLTEAEIRYVADAVSTASGANGRRA
jgi:perosamine synthetase